MNKREVEFLLKNGFFHIFSSQVINKIAQFALSVVVVRFLSKSDYGAWAYASNILSFFLLMSGIGVNSGLLQYASSSKNLDEKLSYFKYSLKVGGVVNSLIALVTFLVALFVKLPVEGSNEVLRYLALFPVTSILFELIQIFLRADLKNKQFSLLTNINTSAYFLFTLILGYFFSLNGIVLSRYLSYIVSIIFGLYFSKYCWQSFGKVQEIKAPKRKEFLTFSFVSALTNSISSILYLIDTLIVGMIIRSNVAVAAYKTATLVPFSLNFIPLSVMTFAYPYFAMYKEDKTKIQFYYKKMIRSLFLINLLISSTLFIFAPQVIRLLFGPNYGDAILPFRVLSIGYLVAGTFRIPSGNVIASLGKVKVNLFNSIVSGTSNVVLDILLIKHYGSVGAAVATVIVFIISSFISTSYLLKYLNS
ncbi:flippase [Thermotoga sp. Ku-13t]|uniref:flippase n=1 Tax=Thermotoga sp. Ku-13t TaxID=1755813 RepID=UPI0024086FEF|nr:flippase [Thermotoga sp. Ku-13t]